MAGTSLARICGGGDDRFDALLQASANRRRAPGRPAPAGPRSHSLSDWQAHQAPSQAQAQAHPSPSLSPAATVNGFCVTEVCNGRTNNADRGGD
eukprot:110918-Rhodomonas_salina.1